MYLKSLKLTGFKSFADRTRLELRPGVTVVVGPNGSGKSNFVDAISWVLGTQSPKALRTGKMEDVIFSGTASRPALNRAEVVLVIDNGDRQVDIDLDEVAITRRLYRDGTSDYELNGVACRLLDIQDLLADSGVGRHQHVIIGQGEIGQVLSAAPEDHRAVIEEAAGILKHRRRKERSERRLERTDEDLLRLQDILTEITRQMRPLRRQAKAAERYDGLKDEVIALRLYLGGQTLKEQDRNLTIATTERARLIESLETDQRRIEEFESDLAALGANSTTAEEELDRVTTAAALLETVVERLRGVASVAHERRRAASGRLEATEERFHDLTSERESIDEELAGVRERSPSLRAAVDQAEALFRRFEDEARALATQTALSPEGALASIRGELSALEAAQSRDQREEASLGSRIEALRSRVGAENGQIAELDLEIRAFDRQAAALQAEYGRNAESRGADQERWSSAEASLSEARLAVASAQARVEAIAGALSNRPESETIAAIEGWAGGRGSLLSRLDVPESLEPAVASALSDWADSIVVDGRDPMKVVLGLVKASGGGSVSFVSADTRSVGVPARDVVAGVDAIVDLLGPEAVVSLAESLLGDVVLISGWAAGWEVVTANPGLRAVTYEGDLITHDRARLSSPDGAGIVMLENAEIALERARTEEARAHSIHTSAKRDFDQTREGERLSLEALESVEAAIAGRSEAMSRLAGSVAVAEAEMTRLIDRKEDLEASLLERAVKVGELTGQIDSLQGEEAIRLHAWQDLEQKRLAATTSRESAMTAWQEADALHRALVERETLLSERSSRISSELERRGAVPNPASTKTLDDVESAARRALTVLEEKLARLRDQQSELRAETGSLRTRLSSIRSEHESTRARIAEAKDQVARLDVRLTELRLEREAVVDSIRRDAGGDVDAAYTAQRPEYHGEVDLDEQMASKLDELTRMGPVNPLAAAEFRDLEERHDFLVSQMRDVEGSRSELRKVIAALEKEIDDQFRVAFDEVAEAFERYFAVLFPGGRGRMRLLDPADRESGVFVEAQPVGKKVGQLSLLSGGERSLAALAFLFAIFDARPSPFYILDEVEAALDDINLRRFLRIVDEFRGRSQLVIVTHQQQTMESADVLYGVTMEPGGASQALRKDMSSLALEIG